MIIYISFFTLILKYGDVHATLKIIDLTHHFDNNTVYWPTVREWSFQLMDAGSDPGLEIEAYRFCAAEHGGTHIDAPKHFSKGKNSVHEVDLNKLVGKLFLVDVSGKSDENQDLLIDTEHIKAAERLHMTTIDDKIVLLYTGYSHYWPNLKEYLGTDTTDTTQLHFPGLEPDAAIWMVENRKVKAVGIDTASIDRGQSRNYRAHRTLMKANIPVFENVNIKEVTDIKNEMMIYALPMKIRGGSGAPLRIIATYE